MIDEVQVFNRIDEAIEPFENYRKALDVLRQLPPGYAMCFASHYVHADILNGGISQLYANSTWSLILDAIDAAEKGGVSTVAKVLKEIVFYYHQSGRSKLKRRISEGYFNDMPDNWSKTFEQLDDEYFDLESEVETVIPNLCKNHPEFFSE